MLSVPFSGLPHSHVVVLYYVHSQAILTKTSFMQDQRDVSKWFKSVFNVTRCVVIVTLGSPEISHPVSVSKSFCEALSTLSGTYN